MTSSTSHAAQTRNFVTALQKHDFDYAPLITCAVVSESNTQADQEENDSLDDVDDALGDVDDELVLPDPWNHIDDIHPTPLGPTAPYKRRHSPSFDEVVASSSPPHTGPHRRRPAKPMAAMDSKQWVTLHHSGACAPCCSAHHPAVPLTTRVAAFTLPATLGAYSAKIKDKKEKLGSKTRRFLANLLGLGFQVIEWDGFEGRIIAVLVGQPDHAEYRATVVVAFHAIRDASQEARFPSTMRKHCHGLFVAINVGLIRKITHCQLSEKCSQLSTLLEEKQFAPNVVVYSIVTV
ncbi:hypothetical protein DFH09DRAFT_1332607 [Mycena vulgaris]|nr:hypothetical protein DFH09DRAFT_1332607 [Mycena vulgaris]